MRFILKMFLATSLVLPCVMAHAQGGCGQPNTFTIHCSANSPAGPCSQDVQITYPQSSQYGVSFGAGFASCCTQNFQTYYPVGLCQTVQMKDPKFMDWLIRVAATQPILVANCSGRYAPFDRAAALSQQARQNAGKPTSPREKIYLGAARISLNGQ